MATTLTRRPQGTAQLTVQLKEDPAYQAFWLLRLGFTIAPIAFGLDKFFGLLTEWEQYLAPAMNDLIPGSASDAMYLVGLVEILAGVVVALRPRIGAYVVAAWLGGIIFNLLLIGDFYDIALRDFGLLLAALTLARLASVFPLSRGAERR